MRSKVAIIIVNYNGWKDTIECLRSLEDITYNCFEVFVVDNASTDKSCEGLRKEISKVSISVTLIEEAENKGFSAGNNIGIRYAITKGFDYFLMLNNDTLVEKNFLDKLLDSFKLDNVGAAIGQIYYASDKRKIWYAGGGLNEKIMKPSHFRFNQIETIHISEKKIVTFATGCCICCSREVLEKIGLWNEVFFLYEEDVELSLRIINAGFRIIYNSDAIIYHKVNASTGTITGNAEYYQIRNRLWLIKEYRASIDKVIANIYTAFMCFNRIRKREYQISPMLAAYKDFMKGKMGKREL